MIEAAWKDYEAKVVPADAPPIQRQESRRAFYAGAQALMGEILGRFNSIADEVTQADIQFMDALNAELEGFKQAVLEGRA